MATALPSPLASSTTTTNGTKLRRLLIDGGTAVLKKIFDGYHPPSKLVANLNENYSTLDNLLRQRILNESQWEQLFPSDRSVPNSGTFDITLLFLLLTEICGLDPPKRTGWNNKPHLKDKSVSAKLVRIKLFRNKLIHLPETRIETQTFVDLWKELSGVLCSLGLNPSEVEKLKVEHCGENDYLDILFKWVDWEKDVKGKLEEVHQTQIKTHEIAKELHNTTLQDHQDSKLRLDEVQQTQTKIHEVVEEVHQTRLQDHQTLQDSKSKLDEVHQNQIKIHEVVEEVHQTRLQDHQTIQDNKSKLEEVRQTQLEEFQKVKEAVGSLKEQRAFNREDEVLRNLAKSEFKGDIEHHFGRYEGNTREWVFKRVQNWLDGRSSQNRVLVISGNAGMGKSVIAAVISKNMQEAGRLAGSHFCQHNNVRYRDPKLMLQSLACHLSHALPDYKHALVEQLSRNLGKDLNNMGVEELFALLFKEPLSTVTDPCKNMLMVIDGLDESEYQERSKLLDAISSQFCKLPVWVRFLVTTRPEMKIAEKLKPLKPFKLEQDNEMNMEDIRTFFNRKLRHVIKTEHADAIVERLVRKSEGLMLYASFLVAFIEENESVLDQGHLDDSLPLGISSVYDSYFKRLENELIKELGVNEEHFLNLLCAVTASREPLPVDLVSKVLVPSNNSPLARRKVLKAIGSVSCLLPIRHDCLHVIHKSVIDWLTDPSCYGEHDFLMDENEGHCILANLCAEKLDHLKQKGVHNAQFSPTEKYALRHSVQHMLHLDENRTTHRLEELTQKYVTDLELVYAKLYVNTSTAAEDLVWFRKQSVFSVLSEESQKCLNNLLALLRKYHARFCSHPRVFFQNVLNEGGRKSSLEASDLLQNKYPEIPYVEYASNERQRKALEARFDSESKVACFDVSPSLDYMVCECRDGTIQLWSLATGRRVWKHPVLLMKRYRDEFTTYRYSPSSSVALLHRSTVFHPSKNVVLPGTLSQCYTIEGDLNPLFPESNCIFSVCSVSGDKARIVTNWPEQAKCLVVWSLEDGSEIARITRNEDVLSFACSLDGRLLAITHNTGLICLVDLLNGFTPLAQTTTSEVCGMICFSPDRQFLVCLHESALEFQTNSLFRLNIINKWMNHFPYALEAIPISSSTQFKPRCEGGYLLGDSFGGLFGVQSVAFEVVLNEQSVLRCFPYSKYVDMLNLSELMEITKDTERYLVNKFVFSLDGETLYVDARIRGSVPIHVLMACYISSGKPKATKIINLEGSYSPINFLVAVKDGVLFTTSNGVLELWNFELSERIRHWSDLGEIRKLIAISEEQVVCVNDIIVIILDTSSGEVKLTVPITEAFVACSSKYEVITRKWSHGKWSVKLHGTSIHWENYLAGHTSSDYLLELDGMFSPAEQFVVILPRYHSLTRVYVLNADSGKTRHCLCTAHAAYVWNFVSDKGFLIFSSDISVGNCFQLFNVNSGDLLLLFDPENGGLNLATCPRKRLIAMDFTDSKDSFKVFHVRLPQDNTLEKAQGLSFNSSV